MTSYTKQPYKRIEKPPSSKACCSCCGRIPLCCRIIMSISAVVIVVALGLFVGFAATNPIHASCRVDWVFPGMTCENVKAKLKTQILTWTSRDNCKNGGEKCLYTYVGESGNQLNAKHTTPVKGYVDDLTFTFNTDIPNCDVEGYSTSETWYAVLDQGTNYCNLHNLITGSGLNNITGYQETTSNSQCTQYSSADCEKY